MMDSEKLVDLTSGSETDVGGNLENKGVDLQGLDANPSDNIEGLEESNAEEISNRRKKNLALSVEEVKELVARLFSGNFDYTETEKGVYKGYWLRDIGSRVTKSIIDTLEKCHAKIKIYQCLDNDITYVQLIVNDREYEMMSLSEFNSTRGDNLMVNRRVVADRSDLYGKRDFMVNLASMPQNINYCHTRIGFDGECRWFKGITLVPLTEDSRDMVSRLVPIERLTDRKDNSISDSYKDNVKLNIERSGDFETFKDGIKTLIKPYPMLTLALAVSVYGVVLQWLYYAGKLNNKENLVMNIAADESKNSSSFGKTTTCKLALVMFGNPESLMSRYDITSARRNERLKELGVVPMCTDDFGVKIQDKSSKEQANIVRKYVFDGHFGETKDVYGKRAVKYYSPLLTSTEYSILKNLAVASQENGGLRRLLEITCEPGDLTADDKHADDLDEFMSRNHGFIDEFIRGLKDKGITADKISGEIDDAYKQLRSGNLFKNSGIYKSIGDAWLHRLAIIAECVELLNKAFDFEGDDKLDYLAVTKILLDNIKNNMRLFSAYRNPDKQAKDTEELSLPLYYNYYMNILQNYAMNKDKFKETRDSYKCEVIEKIGLLERTVTGIDKAEKVRKELLENNIGFVDYYKECKNRCLFVSGVNNIKWLMGIEDESNDKFKSIVRMMLRDGVMFKGNGQGENANTVKIKIGDVRGNYYVVDLGFMEDNFKFQAMQAAELSELYDYMEEGDDE